MANFIYIATSLDGYIATADGGLEWLNEQPNPENSDFGFAEFMDRVDAIVMGRNTFETVLSFGEWPYEKMVFVLSSKLTSVPENLGGKAEIIAGDVKVVVEMLRHRGYHNLYIDGGQVIQSFLKADLIDEMIITRLPILLGGGIPLFAQLDAPLRFNTVKTETLNSWLVKSHYIK